MAYETIKKGSEKISQDLRRAGTGNVDLYSGVLGISHTDIAYSGANLPLNISHIYKSDLAQGRIKVEGAFASSGIEYGLGWKLNLTQKIFQSKSLEGEPIQAVYLDGDGETHVFKKSHAVPNSPGEKYSEQSGNLSLYFHNGTYKIVDQYENEMLFDSSHNFSLKSVKTFDGKTLNIEYDSKHRIISVTDGNSRTAVLSYKNEQGQETDYLQSITDSAGRIIKYEYSSNLLTRIYYIGENGSKDDFTEFGYNGENILISAKDQTGYAVSYEYCYDGALQFKKVNTIGERTHYSNISENGITSYEYEQKYGVSTIDYTTDGSSGHNAATTVTTPTGLHYRYHFNSNGNCVLNYETKDKNKYRPKNWINISSTDEYKTHSVQIQKNLNNINLVKNGDFKSGTQNWSVYPENFKAYGLTDSLVDGNKALKINVNSDIQEPLEFSQEIFIGDDNYDINYALNFFAKIDCDPETISPDTYCRVKLELWEIGNKFQKEITAYLDLKNGSPQFFARPFFTGKYQFVNKIKVKLEINNFIGSVVFDDIRIENANALTTEAKPALIAHKNGVADKIYDFSDIMLMTGIRVAFSLNYVIKEHTKVTPEDINIMQIYKVLSVNKTPFEKLTGIPKIFFKDGTSYNVMDLEILFDREVNAYNKDSFAITKKDVNRDVIEQTVTDKFGTAFKTSYEYKDHKVIKSEDFRNMIITNTYKGADTESIIKNASASPAERMVAKTTKTQSGDYIYKEADPRSTDLNPIAQTYAYDENRDELKKIALPGGQEINYEYFPHSGALKRIYGAYDGAVQTIEFSYTKTLLTRITVNGTEVYLLEYDGFGNLSSAYLNGILIYKTAFERVNKPSEGIYSESTVFFSNGKWNHPEMDCVKTEYDAYSRPLKVYYEKSLVCENYYDSETGQLTRQDIYSGNLNSEMSSKMESKFYSYDETGSYVQMSLRGEKHNEFIGYIRDGDSPKAVGWTIDDITRRTEIEYEKANENSYYPDNRVAELKHQKDGINKVNVHFGYDKLSRISKKTFKNRDENEMGSEEYTYWEASDRTAGFVNKIAFKDIQGANSELSYDYDTNGNITAVYENNMLKARYRYDNLQRLIREDNRELNKTTLYKYDSLGNLQSKGEIPFTVKAIPKASSDNLNYASAVTYAGDGLFAAASKRVVTQVEQIDYGYGSTGMKSLLSYNGIDLTKINSKPYDSEGNPLFYFKHGNKDEQYNLSWVLGKKLKKLELQKIGGRDILGTVEYKYNELGLRTEKTASGGIDGGLHEYFYNGSQLIRENYNGNIIHYFYDNSGVSAIEYIPGGIANKDGGQWYYFQKSLQGDVITIVDEFGKTVVKYAYNAWGKCEILSDTSGYGIGSINPIRYRGYYYDTETGFYYLKARYYDPEVGRFLNADDVSYLQPTSFNGVNLYTYCGNNPVMMTDNNGNSPTRAGGGGGGGGHGGPSGSKPTQSTGNAIGDFFVNNWDIIAGVALTIAAVAIGVALTIATFGAGAGLATLIIGTVTGAVFGGIFGAMSAEAGGGNVRFGFFSGMLVGALGGINPIAAAFGATGMSLLSDRMNGKKADGMSLIKAATHGLTAGLFSFVSSGFGNYMATASADIAVKIIALSLSGFIFSTHNSVADSIFDKLLGW